MTSTRTSPRIGQGSGALSSLGAVGGPRGVSAGALRVIVEFVTQYDPGAVKQLETDMAALDKKEAFGSKMAAGRVQSIDRLQAKIDKDKAIRATQLDATQRKAQQAYVRIAETGSKKQVALAKGIAQKNIDAAVAQGKITKQQGVDLMGMVQTQQKLTKAKSQQKTWDDKTSKAYKEQGTALQSQINQIKGVPGRLGGKLTALGIGALGGLVGGTILGVGWQLGQQAIEEVGQRLMDLLDPARQAREAITDLGDSIAKIASSEGLSYLEATKKYFEDLGIAVSDTNAQVLAGASADAQAVKSVDEWKKSLTALEHPESVRLQNIQNISDAMQHEDEIHGKLIKNAVQNWGTNGEFISWEVDKQVYLNKAMEWYDGIITSITSKDQAAAAAKLALAQATAIAALQAQQFANAMQSATEKQTAPIQAQMENLSTGPSARTQALQDQIDSLQGGGASNQGAQLAEERAILLLKQRLALMGKNIDLEKYSGKFLLAAIEAKIAALNKEGAAQDRLNQLQDLSYRESQKQTRNQGETISDFLERRAQENRAFLKERADIARQDQINNLQDLQDKTQMEVDLAENAEAQKTAAAQSGTSARLKELQKELQASQKADSAALTSKRKALQDQITAIQKASADAVAITQQAELDKTYLAITGAKSLSDWMVVNAQVTALKAARATIVSMIKGFGLPDSLGLPMIAGIDALLRQANVSAKRVYEIAVTGKRGAYQHGGVFPMTNASTVFGQNMRTGEGGTELGVILSNKVTQALRDQQPVQFGDINIQGTNDPRRDAWRMKRAIREGLAEALN